MKAPTVMLGAFALIGIGAVGFVFARPQPSAGITQPIPFSHKKHLVGKDSPKLACSECHRGVETAAAPGLPSLDRCLQCHMKPQSKSEGEKIVRDLAARGGPFEWNSVTRNAAHVYVSHRAHVTLAKLPCATCHGDVTTWDAPPTEPNRKLMSMGRCLDCHRANGAPTTCGACHR